MGVVDGIGVGLFSSMSLYFVVRLAHSFTSSGSVRPRIGAERVAITAHAAMGAGMAAMFSPHGQLVPAAAGAALFAVLGLGALISGSARHVVVACAAMAYMLVVGHGADHQPADHATGHALVSPSVLTWLFTVYFVVAAASLGFRLEANAEAIQPAATTPGPAGRWSPARRFLVSPAVSGGCDVIMSVGMAFMLASAL